MSKIKRFFAGIGILIASMFGYKATVPPEIEHQTPVVSPAPTPVAVLNSENFGITISESSGDGGLNDNEKLTIADGLDLANNVIHSQCFKTSILDGSFTETNGLTNSQIVDLFTHKVILTKFHFFDGSFQQNHWYRTMGYDIGDGTVYANRYFVDSPDVIGSLILHEVAHALGFRHDGVKATSVPYQFNDFFDKCVKPMLSSPSAEVRSINFRSSDGVYTFPVYTTVRGNSSRPSIDFMKAA